MSRAMWWASAVAALAFTVWVGTSWSMTDVSLSCSKIGESRFFQCDDRIVHVLGVWPLVGVGLLLAAPPAVAALSMRKWVSWLVVAVLVVVSIAGLVNWTGYWRLLLFALPLAVLGLVAASLQQEGSRTGTLRDGSAEVA
ncbi:ABC transporter permease [Rhodococcus sp. G-MC3]|uniref:ABC transporter permease n=1 Tax=Rhodococcus sp. G-MC3 TaxID=3046209 RepID=UPI0024B9F234|nr:ABC transporter permease [Rhodococcus sp. G-MC3]MDJ0396750.1 ABC transporter permease [Rhodococcus sp. G-MC3]